jgi:4-aminobutyrate aminotransferase-like enzyme
MTRLRRGDLLPAIAVAPPGPKSRALSARLAAIEAPGTNTLGADDAPALVWSEALGANVVDVDGNRYVDLTSGFGAAAIGHRHPRVVAAVTAQAERLVHGLGDVAAHPARVELAARLAALAPVDEPRVQFAISGADAVEIALKTALLATGRAGVLAFDPGYHGTTAGALAVGARPEFREPFAAQLNPHVRRLPFGGDLAAIEEALADGRVGAVVVEPLVGREGVLVAPAGWLTALAAAACRAGALLVADEIFTGFGRTGDLWICDRESIRPDLLCCGKALGGGLPLAAVVGRRPVMAAWRTPGEALHTATFLAHPLSCAAALAALDVLVDERLVARAARLGPVVGARLAALASSSRRVVAVRGRGLLWGVELDRADAAVDVARGCRERGVLLLAGGASHRVLQLAPPLSIAEEQLERALEVLSEAVAELPGIEAGAQPTGAQRRARPPGQP